MNCFYLEYNGIDGERLFVVLVFGFVLAVVGWWGGGAVEQDAIKQQLKHEFDEGTQRSLLWILPIFQNSQFSILQILMSTCQAKVGEITENSCRKLGLGGDETCQLN